MKENIKTEYVIKEIFNKDGQDIREMLKKAFKEYCEVILQYDRTTETITPVLRKTYL